MENRWKELADVAAAALLDRRGRDVALLDTEEMTTVCDGFLLASGRSTLQVRALADAVEEEVGKKLKMAPLRMEGYQGGRWIVLDYAGLMVHIFHTEDREFYNLEKLWDRGENRTDYRDEKPEALV